MTRRATTTQDDAAAGRPVQGRRGCLTVVLGLFTVLIGIPMLVCPGPGMATIGAGIGMVAVGLGVRTKARQ